MKKSGIIKLAEFNFKCGLAASLIPLLREINEELKKQKIENKKRIKILHKFSDLLRLNLIEPLTKGVSKELKK
ncbi:MAG: hypothetical protein ACTSPV_01125 [Candidatus Hodarchaeales archaeon]